MKTIETIKTEVIGSITYEDKYLIEIYWPAHKERQLVACKTLENVRNMLKAIKAGEITLIEINQ